VLKARIVQDRTERATELYFQMEQGRKRIRSETVSVFEGIGVSGDKVPPLMFYIARMGVYRSRTGPDRTGPTPDRSSGNTAPQTC